jgi:multicomponent Na+:H+ antiporter subunit E
VASSADARGDAECRRTLRAHVMSGTVDVGRNVLSSLLARAAGFLGFWLILSEFGAADLLVGVLAALMAASTSLRLLPPGQWTFRPVVLAGLTVRFLQQSIWAGIDVAWRALDPRLPLRPGFVSYRPQLPPGPARNAFLSMTSLLPGTLPCGPHQEGGLAVHCLDVSQPVVDQLTVEETAFLRAVNHD